MPANDLILLNELLIQRREEHGQGLKEAEYFDIFTAEQVLKDIDLSYDELESGVIDGGGDGGIDSVFFFVNNSLFDETIDTEPLKRSVPLRLVLIQSSTSAGFSEDKVEKFIASARDLFDLSKDLKDLNHVYKHELLRHLDDFRSTYLNLASKFPTVSFEFAYATRGTEVHPNVERKVQILKETVESYFNPCTFSFEFLNASELLKRARKTPKTSSSLKLAENPISTGREGFVCLVKLSDYLAFITDGEGNLRAHIFEGNVRDYQGRTEVNREIRATLESVGAEDFWWLNNGVSVVCSNASLSGKMLTIENAEIVNGLQSSREIFDTFRGRDVSDDPRNVLVRVLKPQNSESRDRIIKATNSQTPIPAASLRATDKIHRDIEEFLRSHGYYYDRRKNYYKNAGKPIKKIFGIPYVAQCVMACALNNPDNARARPSSLIKSQDEYERIFNLDYPLNIYLKCPVVVRRVESILKQSGNPDYRKHYNNLRFYVSMLWVLRQCKAQNPGILQVSEIDISNLTEQSVLEVAGEVWREYFASGGNDQVAKGPELKEVLLDEHRQRVSESPGKGPKSEVGN